MPTISQLVRKRTLVKLHSCIKALGLNESKDNLERLEHHISNLGERITPMPPSKLEMGITLVERPLDKLEKSISSTGQAICITA